MGDNVHTVHAKFSLLRVICTADEQNVKAILSSQANDWEFGRIRGDFLRKLTGSNVFSLEGQHGKESRSRIRAALSRENVSTFSVYERHFQGHLLNVSTDDSGSGWTEVLDLQPIIFGLSLDIIAHILFGSSVHGETLEKQSQILAKGGSDTAYLPDAQSFIDSQDHLLKSMAFASIFGKFYRFTPDFNYYRARNAARKYVDWFVRRRLCQMSTVKADLAAKDKRIVLLNELSYMTQDPIQLRDETVGLLAAGRGTFAALLTTVIYRLAKTPRAFNKLRDTILSELRGCKYLQYCVNEGLRLGTPAGSTIRQALCDTTLPSGGGPDGKSPIFIPKGQQVTLSYFAMHYRADI
ncbi:MAG: hypothetical protein Q9214_002078 [Letrouitia sp. 1 TL-2023]